jgi:hypothetical protein
MVLEEAIQPPEVKQCYGGRLSHAVAGDSWRLGEFTALPLSPPFFFVDSSCAWRTGPIMQPALLIIVKARQNLYQFIFFFFFWAKFISIHLPKFVFEIRAMNESS